MHGTDRGAAALPAAAYNARAWRPCPRCRQPCGAADRYCSRCGSAVSPAAERWFRRRRALVRLYLLSLGAFAVWIETGLSTALRPAPQELTQAQLASLASQVLDGQEHVLFPPAPIFPHAAKRPAIRRRITSPPVTAKSGGAAPRPGEHRPRHAARHSPSRPRHAPLAHFARSLPDEVPVRPFEPAEPAAPAEPIAPVVPAPPDSSMVAPVLPDLPEPPPMPEPPSDSIQVLPPPAYAQPGG